jgi:hypothetical protein
LDLHLELSNVVPRVWRVIRVPDELRLDDLHHVLQVVMGWDDFHPHVFEVGPFEYGPKPEDDGDEDDEAPREGTAWAGEASELTIGQALAQGEGAVTYIYDFAEEWRVRITSIGESDVSDASVSCIAGEHTGPQQETRGLEPFSVEALNKRLASARRPRASPEYPAGPAASADQQLLANLTLVVLLLGSRRTKMGTRESWKNVRVEILDSLTEAGLIHSDPRQKTVQITDAGVAHAERLLKRLRSL